MFLVASQLTALLRQGCVCWRSDPAMFPPKPTACALLETLWIIYTRRVVALPPQATWANQAILEVAPGPVQVKLVRTNRVVRNPRPAAPGAAPSVYSSTGAAASIAANRISFVCGLEGPVQPHSVFLELAAVFFYPRGFVLVAH